MNMEQPTISFVIPMYNAGRYIENCLESIYAQDLEDSDYEIVIVDDGSTDNAREIVSHHKNIRYYWQENQGQSVARNRGIEVATGKYLFFVDADDALVPNSIRSVLETAESKNLNMVTFNIIPRKESTSNTNFSLSNKGIASDVMTGPEYLKLFNYNNSPCCYILRKNYLLEQGLRFISGRFGEDGMFTMELLMTVSSVVHLDRYCYIYIRHSATTTTRRDIAHQRKMIDDYLFVYQHMQGLIGRNADKLSSMAIERCNNRSETYIFFLLIRLLKFPSPRELTYYVDKLKELGVYPIRKPYDGIVYTLSSFVVNHYWVLRTCNYFYNLMQSCRR